MTHFPKNARVAFIGDSITAMANYTARVAEFYKNHLPELGVKFKNCGVSGALCQSALLYYDATVAPFHPTHATVMLGVNDSGRQNLEKTDSEERREKLRIAFKTYSERMEQLLDRLASDGVTVTLCTPAPYAEYQIMDTFYH